MENSFQNVPVARLRESKLNPRRHFDESKILELAESIKSVGVIEPLVTRIWRQSAINEPQISYEIIAGSRRYRAAKLAGLEEIPILVRELDDRQVVEIMVIENNQREDVNPLEEAAGYKKLLGFVNGYDLDTLAQKIGRSKKYVYDRLKLLELVPEAQKILLAGKMTAGHAILLARLKPNDQERALSIKEVGYNRDGGLFAYETELFDRDHGNGDGPLQAYRGFKPRSVREFNDWIDRHVRFTKDVTVVDGMLFPETKQTLLKSFEEKEKIVQVTHNLQTPQDAKAGNTERIFHGTSWKRADGSSKEYKICEKSVTGVIVIGEGRGQAFKVCVNKDCAVHWNKERAERARAAKARENGGGAPKETHWQKEERRRQEEYVRQSQRRDLFRRAIPDIIDACGEKIKEAKQGALLEIIYRAFNAQRLNAARKRVGKGKDLEGVLRVLAMARIQEEASHVWECENFPRRVKGIGVDVAAIIEAQVQASAKEIKPPKWLPGDILNEPTCVVCGCTETKACEGGCAWKKLNRTTKAGVCTACVRNHTAAAKDALKRVMMVKGEKT